MTSTTASVTSTRTWPGAIVIMAIAAFFAYGLPAINKHLPGTAPEPGGINYDLGNGVSVITPTGWSADLPKMKPKDTLALQRDASSLVATAFPWTGNEAELTERTQKLLEGIQHFHVKNAPTPFQTSSGLTGKTYAFFSEKMDGRVWVLVMQGGKVGVAVRVRSIPGQGELALKDAKAIVESIKYQEVK